MTNDTAVSPILGTLLALAMLALVCAPVMAANVTNECNMLEKMIGIHNIVAPITNIPDLPFPPFYVCYPKKFSEYASESREEALKVSVCDEWNACGFGFGNFQGEPYGLSNRCHELYKMRMRNDQRVMECLKNPYEASGASAVEKLHCMQGVNTLDYCLRIENTEFMKQSWCRTNSDERC